MIQQYNRYRTVKAAQFKPSVKAVESISNLKSQISNRLTQFLIKLRALKAR